MFKSPTGMADRVDIIAPGWQERHKEVLQAAVPSCPECGTRMGTFANWKWERKPSVWCQNPACSRAYKKLKKEEW